MSLDIQAARAIQRTATEQLRLGYLSREEIKLAVEILGIVLDELEEQSKAMGDLRDSMTYKSSRSGAW